MNSLNQSWETLFRTASALPWLFIALAIIPFAIASWRTRIFPTKRWLFLIGISLLSSVANIFSDSLLPIVLLIDGATLLIGWIDFIVFWQITNGGIDVDREHARTCSIGVAMEGTTSVRNRTPATLSGHVRDDLPDTFAATPSEHAIKLPPGSEATFSRKLTPHKRGAFQLHHVYLQLNSPLRFWNRYLAIPKSSQINVYPDMKQMADYAMLARTDRLSLIGVRRTRRIGQDSDFERLRDYSRDDNYRHIDWRSTARRRKLTVKQFQTDQSQRVIFMLDCGRMMTNESGGMSLLDHALNASLMMAYVALQQGDSVGMLCFSDTIHAYIPPRGGSSQMNRLLQAGFDQFPRMVESRYDQAFVYLQNHCKRRSLVTLTTNVIDEVNAASVVDYLGNLAGQHLPLGVLLRDRVLFEAADLASDRFHDAINREVTDERNPGAPDAEAQRSNAEGSDTASDGRASANSATNSLATIAPTVGDKRKLFRGAAAADILIWRQQVIRDMQHRGVLCVDAFPDELTAPLVNQYLEVKAKHLL